ncbi:MAG: DMT family transporter [Clostridia bacterium]|nr:DMT family transporter [Clostridia bacterium]
MQSQMQKKTGPAMLAAAVGNGIFGFSFMFSRMAMDAASPLTLLMYRFTLAFLFINIVALWAHLTKKEGWLRFRIPWKKSLPLFVLGLLQPVIYFLCESWGIKLTNATVSGVIIALIPIAALGGGALFLKEKPSLPQIGFSLLCILGVIVMTLQQGESGGIQPLGIVLLVGAVLFGAMYNMFSRKISAAFSALERTYVMMLVGAVVFSLLACMENGFDSRKLFLPLQNAKFMLAMGYLSLFSSILAFLCLNYAATILPVSRSTAFCNLTTVLSVLAGVVFLQEPFTLLSGVAAVVIIIGVFGVQKT